MTATLRRYRNWILVLLIAAVALFLRLYAIDRLPPGLFGDEAVEGLDALDVLAGNFAIWFHAHLGREPLFVYLVALAYRAFGVTPLATRVPAILAGLLTLPAAFFFAREWALAIFSRERSTRLALLTTALLAISFWHVEMTRNAHRDTLLPLVEALGCAFLWRGIRARDWRWYAAAGMVLGLAIYTYSPGRFVGVFIAIFVVVEWLVARLGARTRAKISATDLDWRGIVAAGALAIVVMLPLGIYFVQNPVQFSRRFQSVSIFDFPVPAQAFATSVAGNLAQFVIPGAGYASKHYNLPGKPVFDLLIAPWFLAGILLAFARARRAEYRFLILWFIVMATPAFLTADMIPKGVRVLGVVPGVFVFPALAMDALLERARSVTRSGGAKGLIAGKGMPRFAWNGDLSHRAAVVLIALCLIGSAMWTTYDYFVAWANLPELPLAFDTDMVEVSNFVQRQPADQPVWVSAEVYRHPTLMLLGKRVPTSQYFDRATRVREFDARTSIVVSANQPNALYVFVREQAPPAEWLARVAPQSTRIEQGTYFAAYRLGALATPQQSTGVSFNPLLKLIGYSRYDGDPRGVVLYWQVTQLPDDRTDMQATLALLGSSGVSVAQGKHTFGVPPMEWAMGDVIADWYDADTWGASQFSVRLTRGVAEWQSPALALK